MSNIVESISNMSFPSRSMFQLRQFVIGQHDTPQMRFRQIVIEIQDLEYKIKSAKLSIAKTLLEAEKLEATGDPIDAIDAKQKRLDAAHTNNALNSALTEFEYLLDLLNQTEHFTLEEIEQDQPKYWRLRLKRQADIDIFSTQHGINAGNVTSLLSAGLLETVEEVESSEISVLEA